MKRKVVPLAAIFIIVILVAAAAYFAYNFAGVRPVSRTTSLEGISVPEGFAISVFAENLSSNAASYPGPNNGPRLMAYYGDVVIVSLTSQGKVIALPDENHDGKADRVITVAENLQRPHGLAVYNNELYIAEENKVIKGTLDSSLSLQKVSTVVDNLPTGGHFTRTIVIKDDALYISIGSDCNVCREEDNHRAAVLKCSLDGNCSVFASGLRNSVGLAFNPTTGELWATDNGRDMLGNDVPPEDINILKEGKNYGWPICYGNKIHDTDFDKNVYIRDPCADSVAPAFEMQAHSAPLGLAFYTGKMFPEEYKGDLFVAFHGSWNRNPPTGYKVVRIRIKDGIPVSIEDFASGWLNSSVVSGRPVDVIVAKDGALLVSDDSSGRIYKISYGGK